MSRDLTVDICVIGAGSGGLSVAAGASQMGARVALIERGKMGGDCLNYGCVPSKAMLAAGHAAEAHRRSARFGIGSDAPDIDAKGVFGHIHGTIAAIAPNDSVERFEGLGVKVIQAQGRFTGPAEVTAGDTRITARRFVVATGSSAFVPPIPGLEAAGYHTNETVFYADRLPSHLIVVGGGPIGIELAQAHRHLGAKVTVLELFTVMPKDDPELVDVVRRQLHEDGIEIVEGVTITRIEKTRAGVAVMLKTSGDAAERRIEGSDILVATGRRANVDGLDLEKAGIKYSPKGIEVDQRLRTSNKRVFAIGDVAGGLQFTHVAGYHAGVVIKNALFRLPAKVDTRAVPWVTFTTPELAQVGLTETEAAKTTDAIRILRWPYHENDRAQAEGATEGMIKAVVTPKGKILGCGIVGAHAGELIQTWVLAISQNVKIGGIAQMVAPYPTLGEVSKRAAGSFYTPQLFSERTRKIVRFLARFG
ncbi:MAG TPA: FAD-dependent oxidoreductase [Rhodospirillales bacterium]|jgi:pyruvate/2-oxoglutarate dehydrogenase complex dihydrolipoamide dehydrogenase (E3) component